MRAAMHDDECNTVGMAYIFVFFFVFYIHIPLAYTSTLRWCDALVGSEATKKHMYGGVKPLNETDRLTRRE